MARRSRSATRCSDNEGPFGAHAQYMGTPQDGSITTMSANVTYEEAAPSTEGSHYALAPIWRGEDHQRAGRPRLWRNGSHRLGGGPTLEESRCQGDGRLRHGPHGPGQGLWALTGSSTTPPRTSPTTIRPTTWSWTRLAGLLQPVQATLKPAGIYISSELGPHAQNPFLALIAPLQRGKRVMFPIPKHDQEMMRYFRELIESGQFKPVIDRTYRLDQIVEAYHVETNRAEDRQCRHHRRSSPLALAVVA